MGISKMAKKTLYDKADKKLQRIAGTIGAVVAIIGAISGAFGWIQSQFVNAISTQINDFRQEVKASNDAQDLAIMRLELMNLIQNNPDNTVEIEMLGKKYFNPPYNGDSYMSVIYSEWANARGLDTSFITH